MSRFGKFAGYLVVSVTVAEGEMAILSLNIEIVIRPNDSLPAKLSRDLAAAVFIAASVTSAVVQLSGGLISVQCPLASPAK